MYCGSHFKDEETEVQKVSHLVKPLTEHVVELGFTPRQSHVPAFPHYKLLPLSCRTVARTPCEVWKPLQVKTWDCPGLIVNWDPQEFIAVTVFK